MLGACNMLSKYKPFEAFARFEQRTTWNMCEGIVYKCFCNMSESPELPNWVKSPSDGNSTIGDSIDDFVLPTSLNNYIGNQKVEDGGSNIRRLSSSVSVDKEVDEISAILKTRHTSPEEVVKVLDGWSFVVSESLVEKVMKRFSHDWISAFGLFKWYQKQTGYKSSPGLYDLIVDILGKAKMFDMMWDLVVEMVFLGGLVSLTTMSKIMRRLTRAGRWVDAIVTFREIERFGLIKDVVTMNVLLDSLCKERGVEHAWDVFSEFKNEIPPNSHTFNVLLHGCCKARQLNKAQWTLEEMERCGIHPCVISYTSLIEAYCRDKDFRKVDALLDEMQFKGCSPNVVTYTIVMHALGKAKETYEALGIYERMKKNGCVPDTSFYNSLIYICSKAGRLQEASKIFDEMSKSGCTPDVTTYNTMISVACAHSQVEDALKLLQEMEERLCKPDLKTYAPLLKICCRRKWMKILFFLLSDMFKKDISLEVGTYSLLVNGLCKSGNVEQACLFFEEMVLKGQVPWSSTYHRLVEELERKNMEKEKEKIQKLMTQAESLENLG